jgi:hypothetical protein
VAHEPRLWHHAIAHADRARTLLPRAVGEDRDAGGDLGHVPDAHVALESVLRRRAPVAVELPACLERHQELPTDVANRHQLVTRRDHQIMRAEAPRRADCDCARLAREHHRRQPAVQRERGLAVGAQLARRLLERGPAEFVEQPDLQRARERPRCIERRKPPIELRELGEGLRLDLGGDHPERVVERRQRAALRRRQQPLEPATLRRDKPRLAARHGIERLAADLVRDRRRHQRPDRRMRRRPHRIAPAVRRARPLRPCLQIDPRIRRRRDRHPELERQLRQVQIEAVPAPDARDRRAVADERGSHPPQQLERTDAEPRLLPAPRQVQRQLVEPRRPAATRARLVGRIAHQPVDRAARLDQIQPRIVELRAVRRPGRKQVEQHPAHGRRPPPERRDRRLVSAPELPRRLRQRRRLDDLRDQPRVFLVGIQLRGPGQPTQILCHPRPRRHPAERALQAQLPEVAVRHRRRMVLRQLLRILGQRLRRHRACEGELQKAIDAMLLVDLERMHRLRGARLAEHRRREARRPVLDERAPRLLVKGRQELRHRLAQLRRDPLDAVARVPGLGLGLARVLLELLHHVERIPRVLRIMDQRPPGKPERPLALLAHRPALLARPEPQRRHLELITRRHALRRQPHHHAPGQHRMPVRARDHAIDRLVLAELGGVRHQPARLQCLRHILLRHGASCFSTTRAA